jgi:hypothetical protein
MQLRTTFKVPHFEPKITFQNSVFSMGSCFSAMIGKKLLDRKFKVLNNPFGTIYNPVSLFQLIQQSLTNSKPDPSLLLEYQQRYYHYGMHSSISANKEEALWRDIANAQFLTREFVSKAAHLFITFGTAFIYEMKSSGKTVANCHKQPRTIFNKRLLGLDKMEESFYDFHTVLQECNPDVKIIVTVSPVRHIKDGVPENQLSKSLLRVFSHHLQEKYKAVSYFPSYELMMDDLRDYRFYKEDLIHPTPLAEDYIWEVFKDCYLDKTTIESLKTIEGIIGSLQHKPFHPESDAHRQFLFKLLQKMERLSAEFDFSNEIREVKGKLGTDF